MVSHFRKPPTNSNYLNDVSCNPENTLTKVALLPRDVVIASLNDANNNMRIPFIERNEAFRTFSGEKTRKLKNVTAQWKKLVKRHFL